MKLPSLQSKLDYLTIVACIMVILGVFGPWLWRGYNPYQVVNPGTLEKEVHYRLVTQISPFSLSVIMENNEKTTKYFTSVGTTASGIILISSAILFNFTFKQKWMKNLFFFISILALSFFFLSLGGNLWLGLVTRFSWGIQITSLGLMIMFFSLLIDIFL